MRLPRTKASVAFMVLWSLVAVAIATGLVAWTKIEGQEAVRATLRDARPWLLLWRLCLLSFLMICWRPVVASIGRYFQLSTSAERALRNWKWRAGAGLVLMDLILVEDLLGVLRHAI